MYANKKLRKLIGERMFDLREKAELSQVVVARRTGVTQASISNYENGIRELPIGLALRLSRLYGVEVTRLASVGDL